MKKQATFVGTVANENDSSLAFVGGSHNVFVNGSPMLRFGDPLYSQKVDSSDINRVVKRSTSVRVNAKPVALSLDNVNTKPSSSHNVYVGS